MTNEERMNFVRTTINEDPTWEAEYVVTDETVRKIVDRWETDVADEANETLLRGKSPQHGSWT